MQKVTLTDRIRQLSSGFIVPMGQRFKAMGVHPDTLTIAGLVIVAIGAVFLATGQFFVAGLVLLIGLPVDALDGATARAYGSMRPFGAFLDSTLDRYADALIFGALTYYYADHNNMALVVGSLVALHGSLTVSYTRARAEGLGLECKVGWLSRLERVVLLLVALGLSIFDVRAVAVGVILLAAGTQFTALQRILHVAREAAPLKKQI
jgi:CDP-diacylglycerol---glycerol-3-phosphate 3-phosphatidyltransferase